MQPTNLTVGFALVVLKCWVQIHLKWAICQDVSISTIEGFRRLIGVEISFLGSESSLFILLNSNMLASCSVLVKLKQS